MMIKSNRNILTRSKLVPPAGIFYRVFQVPLTIVHHHYTCSPWDRTIHMLVHVRTKAIVAGVVLIAALLFVARSSSGRNHNQNRAQRFAQSKGSYSIWE
jgi:hypothetical protein